MDNNEEPVEGTRLDEAEIVRRVSAAERSPQEIEEYRRWAEQCFGGR